MPPGTPTLWLEADSGVFKDAGVTPASDGDTVQQWNDQSGNSNNATQATGANRPTYHTSYLAGKTLPAIVFGAASSIGMTTPLSVSTPYTIGVVFGSTDSTGGSRRAVQGSSNWIIGPYSNTITHYAGGFVTGVNAGTPFASTMVSGGLSRVIVTNTGSASHAFLNGVDITKSSGNTGAPGTLTLGATGAFNEPCNGPIAAVIAYSSVLSAGDITLLDNYLSRWMPWAPLAFFAPPARQGAVAKCTQRQRNGLFVDGNGGGQLPEDRVTGVNATFQSGSIKSLPVKTRWGTAFSWDGGSSSDQGMIYANAAQSTLPKFITLFSVCKLNTITDRPTFISTGTASGLGLAARNASGTINPMFWKVASANVGPSTTVGWPCGDWVAYAVSWNGTGTTATFYLYDYDTRVYLKNSNNDANTINWTNFDSIVSNSETNTTVGGIDGEILLAGYSYKAWTDSDFAQFVGDPYWPIRAHTSPSIAFASIAITNLTPYMKRSQSFVRGPLFTRLYG